MKKFLTLLFTTVLAFIGLTAHAAPEALPDGAKVMCTKNDDGTGTVTIAGVEVKRLELYIHKPVSKMKILKTAPSYNIAAYSTFNFVWKNAAGEDRYVLVGADPNAAKVFGDTKTMSQFSGVMEVPDAKNGGIGGPGASLACSHMLRAKVVTGPNL